MLKQDLIGFASALLIFLFELICTSSSLNSKGDFDIDSTLNFRPHEGSFQYSKLGLEADIMVQIETKAGSNFRLWRTNINYTTPEMISSLKEICDTQPHTIYSDAKDDYLGFSNCTYSSSQITALTYGGEEEDWHRNFTYYHVRVRPFKSGLKSCVLDELDAQDSAYLVLVSHDFLGPSDDVNVEERIYKLEEFLPNALVWFEDFIEEDKILNFGSEDFMKQSPQYKCLLALTSGSPELEKLCKFKCHEKLKDHHTEL